MKAEAATETEPMRSTQAERAGELLAFVDNALAAVGDLVAVLPANTEAWSQMVICQERLRQAARFAVAAERSIERAALDVLS